MKHYLREHYYSFSETKNYFGTHYRFTFGSSSFALLNQNNIFENKKVERNCHGISLSSQQKLSLVAFFSLSSFISVIEESHISYVFSLDGVLRSSSNPLTMLL